MKKSILITLVAVLGLLVAFAGCSKTEENQAATTTQDSEQVAASAPAADPNVWRGTVAETMDSGGYTYALLDMDDTQKWVAGPVTTVAVGDKVIMSAGMEMRNFKSNSMDRTFDVIYFVAAIEPDDGHSHAADGSHDSTPAAKPQGGMPGMMGGGGSSGHTTTDVAGVEGVDKAAGGVTVAEIYGQSADLANQSVTLRGRVVKFTPNIMGTNWIHVQDGTGSEGTHDLTVTTSATVQVGDLVVIKGAVTVNKDFGAGYRYAVIIENADITVE